MKFKLQATQDDGTIVTHDFECYTWYSALDSFVRFLRGNGYHLRNDSVGINLDAGHMFIEDEQYDNITFFGEES